MMRRRSILLPRPCGMLAVKVGDLDDVFDSVLMKFRAMENTHW
jgi:hypothetical protein